MVSHESLVSMFKVHRGPRRWVPLPYAILCAFSLLAGFFMVQDLLLLLPYSVLLPIFVIQIALPTRAGWIVAFSAWVMCCSGAILLDYRAFRLGVYGAAHMWVLLALAVLSSAPLYLLRPGARRAGQGAGRPREKGEKGTDAFSGR
jgi:hypothetical protein